MLCNEQVAIWHEDINTKISFRAVLERFLRENWIFNIILEVRKIEHKTSSNQLEQTCCISSANDK